jgi:hypothetical protein
VRSIETKTFSAYGQETPIATSLQKVVTWGYPWLQTIIGVFASVLTSVFISRASIFISPRLFRTIRNVGRLFERHCLSASAGPSSDRCLKQIFAMPLTKTLWLPLHEPKGLSALNQIRASFCLVHSSHDSELPPGGVSGYASVHWLEFIQIGPLFRVDLTVPMLRFRI